MGETHSGGSEYAQDPLFGDSDAERAAGDADVLDGRRAAAAESGKQFGDRNAIAGEGSRGYVPEQSTARREVTGPVFDADTDMVGPMEAARLEASEVRLAEGLRVDAEHGAQHNATHELGAQRARDALRRAREAIEDL